MMSIQPSRPRFAVALSFPGEKRSFVEAVADGLSSTLSRERVLYDRYHDAEFARLDLDLYLPRLYREHAELLVIFLCPEYAGKRWCNLEWRHIRQLISTIEASKIMLLRFGDDGDLAELGILPGDGYIDISACSADEVVSKILERIGLHREVPYAGSGATQMGVATKGSLAISRSGLYGLLPERSTIFIGRNDALANLESVLTQNTYTRVAPSIEGLAGLGKTELALQLVHKLDQQNAFPGGIYWLDAEHSDLTIAWGSQIADALHISGTNPAQRAHNVIRHLSNVTQPLLIVLDNVAAWAPGQKPGPLPEGSHVRFLVTTRVRDLGAAQFQHLDVGVIQPPNDAALLTSIAGRAPFGVETLLSHLEGHALGLELAGAFLRRYKDWSATEYLHALNENDEGLTETLEAKVATRVRYDRTVAQAFSTIWARLEPREQQAWQLASCFAPEFATRDLADTVGLDEDLRLELEDWHLIRTTEDVSVLRDPRKFGE